MVTLHRSHQTIVAGSFQAACRYRYDAAGRLAGMVLPAQSSWRFWKAGRIVNDLRRGADGDAQLTWLRCAGAPIAELEANPTARTSLLASGISGSVLLEVRQEIHRVQYTPQGHRSCNASGGEPNVEPAHNGEMLDAASGCYLLGAGHHRPYSPTLGHFLAPDRAGPFGRGGLNTLSYCAGDPVNRVDPSGHFWKWLVAGVAVLASAIAVVATAGTAIAAIGGISAGGGLSASGAGAIAGTTLGLAGVAAESASLISHGVGNATVGNVMGYVGLGLGMAGFAGAVPALAKMASKAATRIAAKASRFMQRQQAVRLTSFTAGQGSTPSLASGISSRSAASSISSRGAWSRSPASLGSRGGTSRLVGYHGTSTQAAGRMLDKGANGLYLTDSYEAAAYYARIASAHKDEVGGGVVLGLYSDDVEGLSVNFKPKMNSARKLEVMSENQRLRAVRVEAGAPDVDDFFDFWMETASKGSSIADQLRQRLGETWYSAAMAGAQQP